jgi:hypothetical protein
MFTTGNTKLGRGKRIWSFGLPSRQTCPGRSDLCARVCYAHRLESFRPTVRARYLRNLALSRHRDFADRVVAFLRARQIEVVRVHIAGDFYSGTYARTWLTIMRQLPSVHFFLYSRSWRMPAIRRVLTTMARLPNTRVWYSVEREIGVPRSVQADVRVAWMMTSPVDLPPRADLVFRVHRLRGRVQKRTPFQAGGSAALVCPVENGVTGHRTTCEKCKICWQPSCRQDLIPLNVVD